ncbi:MAG: hypothetical protein ABW022_11050 [Actinoplanes sp.]
MATETELGRFRRATALAADDAVYTDAVIDGMIEDLGYDAAIATVWREKAAAASALVDTTESGSSRSLSQLRKGYLEMANASNPGEVDPGDGGGSFTVEIERV